MSSPVSNWLKLNKLLDQYSREGRDITVTISCNIRWDSILLDTFKSSNNTAIHYAAVALPKILSFPSALVIFASLERSSLLLGEFLAWLYREVRENGRASAEANICSRHLTQHYSQLQTSSPNVRRVCSVFCDNLLQVSILVLHQGTLVDTDCSGVRGIMVSALFHTSLLEDYTNLFRKKLRKTEHVQKLFSVLTRLGDSADPLTLESYYKFLPELVSDFLTAFSDFQSSCKQFSILAFSQFIIGLKLETGNHLVDKLECLSLIIEKLESHLRVLPNDPDLLSAETETFSGILSVLMNTYSLFPEQTARCMANIQRINHSILEANLTDIFRIVFSCDVSKLLLDSVFGIYSKLSQLDKLVQIIIEAAGKLDRAPIQSMFEFKNVAQKYFSTSSLNTCNKCIKLLLSAVEMSSSQTRPGMIIQSDFLSYILSVSPVGDLNATPTQRNEFLQLLTQLHSLIQSYDTTSSRLHIICYFIILDAFILSVLVIGQLPVSKFPTLSSIQNLEIQQFDEFIIPTKWAGQWEEITSKFDKELMKRLREIQINTFITLSRFSHSATKVIPISPPLSQVVERYLTCHTSHTILPTILQHCSLYLDKLSHLTLLSISEIIVRLDTNTSNDTELINIVFSDQFKEIRLLHSYLSYTIMIQVFNTIESCSSHDLATKINQELYSKLINKLDSKSKENVVVIDTNSIIQDIESLLSTNSGLAAVNTDCYKEIIFLMDKFGIIPLSCISVQLKLNLLLGMEVLLVLLAASKTLTEKILCYCVTLMRGVSSKLKSRKTEVLTYLSTLGPLAKCIYRIALDNNLTTSLCYDVFAEICLLLFDKNKDQYVSLTNYAIQLCHQISQANISQIPDIQLDLTYAIINCGTNRPVSVTAALNELVEITTPILLKSISVQVKGKILKLLSANLTYIILANKSEQSQQIEEAINTVIRQVLKFIQNSRIDDVTALESLVSIANTLKQHSYSVDIQIGRVLSLITIQDLDWEVLISEHSKNSIILSNKLAYMNREFVVGWIACSDINNFRYFLCEIIDRIDTEFVRSCHILCSVIEGNIPDTHRSEIRKVFQKILSNLTKNLLERELDRIHALIALRLVTSVFKLPSRIGLSSRSVVEALTCLSLLPLLSFVDSPDTLLPLYQTKSSSLHYMLRNYPDCAISCIPTFLLVTKELIRCVFSLHNNTEFPILTRLLESYTTLPPLSNYTHQLIHQYIATAQEYAEKQMIKKTLKPSIFALIGFSKPETLLSLQAQLDTNGRAFYKEMREEYEKFYRFKGKT